MLIKTVHTFASMVAIISLLLTYNHNIFIGNYEKLTVRDAVIYGVDDQDIFIDIIYFTSKASSDAKPCVMVLTSQTYDDAELLLDMYNIDSVHKVHRVEDNKCIGKEQLEHNTVIFVVSLLSLVMLLRLFLHIDNKQIYYVTGIVIHAIALCNVIFILSLSTYQLK